MSSIDFIRKILVGKLHSAKVVVGFNHHFGHNQEGNYEALYQLGKYHGFDVEEIPEQDIENETVSSTRIRGALLEGKIQRANAYLDHYYMIIGKPELMNIPGLTESTVAYHIIIEEDCKLIPPEGTYAVTIMNEGIASKGLIYVTNRNGFGYAQNLGRFVYLLPFDNLTFKPDLHITLYFHKMISEEAPSFQTDPKRQLERDIIETQELIY